MTTPRGNYAARLEIDYQAPLDRLTTAFRLLLAIPILIVLGVITGGSWDSWDADGQQGAQIVIGGTGLLFLPVLFLIVFRQKYPRWWFNWHLEFSRFSHRVAAYILLLTDRYPSTDEEQTVHLDLDYPNVQQDLNRWLPLVKWLLAIPHYIVLFFLGIAAFFVVIIAWFAILFTGRYPEGMFTFIVGVMRWALRVEAYAFLLITDDYPPFSLDAS